MPGKKKTSKKQNDFSSDQPIISSGGDRLGRTVFANALAERIQKWKSRDTLVIALCGEWGCGKTSLKNLVVERLRSGKQPIVDLLEYNPWEFSGNEPLAPSFFRELSVTLGAAATDNADTNRRLAKFRAYSKILALGGTAATWFGKAMSASGHSGGTLLEVAGEAANRTAEAVAQGADAQETKDKIGDLSHADLKRSIARDMADLKRPILVVIDDIDRLTSDETRQVFQLVKANADFPNLVYLLMFDRNIVAEALDTISGKRGAQFLEKIVQVLFHVPQPSLKDVHKMLFDGLDQYLGYPGVSERWETPRWSRVWPDGLSQYFTNLRHVYRFLSSFGFQVSHMSAGRTFELNPLDLVVLETLRLFEPELYELIPSNRGFFVGSWPAWSIDERDADKKRGVELDRILSNVPDERRSRVREILSHLFPALFGHNHPDKATLLRGLRVGHELIFERYFTLGIPNDDVSQLDIDSLREAAGNAAKFSEVCAVLLRSGKLEVALERLDAYRRTFPLTIFPAFITGLADIADSLPYRNRVMVDVRDGLTYAWRQVYFGLKEITEESTRFDLLRDGITASRGVRLPTEIVSLEVRHKGNQNHDYLVEEAHCEALKPLAVERLRSAAKDGRLRTIPDLVSLLYRWKEFTNQQEVRLWVVSQLNTAQDGLWILRTLLSTMTRSAEKTTYVRFINLKAVELFADIDLIVKLTKGLEIGKLPEDDRRALRAFRYAVAWRAEGKPDGYHGGDFGDESPLAEDT